MGTSLSEAHTGYRAYSRRLLLTVPFLRNSHDFVFDSELLMQASHFGFTIAEVPARCRYFDDASSVGFSTGVDLRAEDALGGVPPDPAPARHRAVAASSRSERRQLHHLEAAARGAIVRSRKRSSMRSSANCCSGASRPGVLQRVGVRVGPQRAQRLERGGVHAASGRRRAARRAGGAVPAAAARRRSSSPTVSPSSSLSIRPAAQEDLDRHVGRGEHQAARPRPGMWRSSTRSPAAPRGSSGGRSSQRRSSASGSESPPGAAWASAERGKRSPADDHADGEDEHGDRQRARQRRARAAVRRAQQHAEPERDQQQARQRDVDEDVLERAVDPVGEQHDPVGGQPRQRDQRRPLAPEQLVAPSRKLDQRRGRRERTPRRAPARATSAGRRRSGRRPAPNRNASQVVEVLAPVGQLPARRQRRQREQRRARTSTRARATRPGARASAAGRGSRAATRAWR